MHAVATIAGLQVMELVLSSCACCVAKINNNRHYAFSRIMIKIHRKYRLGPVW